MELTRCDENTALVALHDSDNDVEQAVLSLLEGDQMQDEWIVQEGKKGKKQHQQNSDDLVNDDLENYGGKAGSNRRRGGRGGGNFGGADGFQRSRGRRGGADGTSKNFFERFTIQFHFFFF